MRPKIGVMVAGFLFLGHPKHRCKSNPGLFGPSSAASANKGSAAHLGTAWLVVRLHKGGGASMYKGFGAALYSEYTSTDCTKDEYWE